MIYLTISNTESKHHHVAFIDLEQRGGLLLENKNHEHEITVTQDDQGNMDLVVEPSEDGHTHKLRQYPVEDMDAGNSEEDTKHLISEIKNNFSAWYELQSDSFEKGKQSLEYYKGNQHETEGREKLLKNDRTCLTINEITPSVDLLLGYQAEHKTDFMVLPRENGDSLHSELGTELLKYVSDFNKFEKSEGDVFRDMVVTGRGCIELSVDDEENLEGDIILSRPAWDEVVYAAHQQQDLKDCEGMIKYKYISEHKLEQIAPDIFDEEDKPTPDPDQHNVVSDSLNEQPMQTDYTGPASRAKEMIAGGKMVYMDPVKKQYLVLERWLKVYRQVDLLVSKDASIIFSMEGWKKSHVNKIKKAIDSGHPLLANFKIIKKRVTRMWVTTVAGNKILSNEYPAQLPKGDFYTVPAYGYFYDGDWWGKVEIAKGPQDELNKRASQTVDIVNRMCVYVWFVEPGTFKDDSEEARFLTESTKPGSVFYVNDKDQLPHKMDSESFPDGLVRLTEISSQRIQKALNINPEQNEDYSSGQVYLLRRETKITANQFLLDNLALMKAKVGMLTLGLIQQQFSASRIDRIVNDQREGVDEQGQPVPPVKKYPLELIQEFKENVDFLKYDCVIAESEFAPSAILGMFATLSTMMEKGLPVDPRSLVEYAPVPQSMKDQVSQQIRGEQENQQAQATAGQDAEVEKTLIGQGLIPPATAEKFGVTDQVAQMKGMPPQQQGSEVPPMGAAPVPGGPPI